MRVVHGLLEVNWQVEQVGSSSTVFQVDLNDIKITKALCFLRFGRSLRQPLHQKINYKQVVNQTSKTVEINTAHFLKKPERISIEIFCNP